MAVLAKRPYGHPLRGFEFLRRVGHGGDGWPAIGPFLPLRPLRPLDTSSCLRTVQNVYAFLRLIYCDQFHLIYSFSVFAMTAAAEDNNMRTENMMKRLLELMSCGDGELGSRERSNY